VKEFGVIIMVNLVNRFILAKITDYPPAQKRMILKALGDNGDDKKNESKPRIHSDTAKR
jgi:hypothetical protein